MHRLEQKLRKRLIGERYGSLETLFKWQWVAVRDTRRYQPGDQKATINRKQSAKRDQLYVNEYEAERTATVDLFLDINANRSTGVEVSNRSLARDFLADYMVFAIENSLITIGYLPHKEEFLTRSLWNERERMGRYNDIEQLVASSRKNGYQSALSLFLQRAKTITKRRVIIIVADFLDLTEQDKNLLQRLEQRSIVICIRIPTCLIIWKWYSYYTTKKVLLNIPAIAL